MEPWLLIWMHLSHRNDLLLSYYTREGPCYQGIYTLDLGCWLWFTRHNDLTEGPSPIAWFGVKDCLTIQWTPSIRHVFKT
jgi:hypothetical protein